MAETPCVLTTLSSDLHRKGANLVCLPQEDSKGQWGKMQVQNKDSPTVEPAALWEWRTPVPGTLPTDDLLPKRGSSNACEVGIN